MIFAVAVNDLVSFFFKFKSNVTGGSDLVLFSWLKKIVDKAHQCGFSATNRACQQDAFSQIKMTFFSFLLVFNRINNQTVNQNRILWVQAKRISVCLFSQLFKPAFARTETELVFPVFDLSDFIIGVRNNPCRSRRVRDWMFLYVFLFHF